MTKKLKLWLHRACRPDALQPSFSLLRVHGATVTSSIMCVLPLTLQKASSLASFLFVSSLFWAIPTRPGGKRSIVISSSNLQSYGRKPSELDLPFHQTECTSADGGGTKAVSHRRSVAGKQAGWNQTIGCSLGFVFKSLNPQMPIVLQEETDCIFIPKMRLRLRGH